MAFLPPDAIGFDAMDATERANYLRHTLRLDVPNRTGSVASGADILWTLVGLDFPVGRDGLINRQALLRHVIRELGGSVSRAVLTHDREETVINVLLAVDMLDVRKVGERPERIGYVPAEDVSMFRLVLAEISKMPFE